MENDGEIWKDIVGYEGRYQVSTMEELNLLILTCINVMER